MSDPSAPSSPETGPKATVPVRSPRTSIILAELARQRRVERCQRRRKRQQRRRTWARRLAWLAAFGRRRLSRFVRRLRRASGGLLRPCRFSLP